MMHVDRGARRGIQVRIEATRDAWSMDRQARTHEVWVYGRRLERGAHHEAWHAGREWYTGRHRAHHGK